MPEVISKFHNKTKANALRLRADNTSIKPATKQAEIVKLNNEKIFFPNLDGFRFMAFLLVFLHHSLAEIINSMGEGGAVFTTLRIGLFQSAPLGVSFFFVLSGFLITYLILTEQNQRGQVDVKAFYARRALRIWPLYYALFAIAFIVLPFFTRIKLPNPAYYLLFLSNFDLLNHPGSGTGITDIMWSVAVEEQFYLVWPLLFYVVERNYQVYLFAGIIILSAVFRWANQLNDQVQHFHTMSVISELAIGGLTAYCSIHYSRFQNFLENLPRWGIIATYVAALPVILFSRFFYAEEGWGRVILGGALATIILEQNFSKNSFYKMKNFQTISFLGKYTYGLYLFHPLVILLVYGLADYFKINKSAIVTGSGLAIISLTLSIVICYVSYHYYEAPFLRLKNHFSRVTS